MISFVLTRLDTMYVSLLHKKAASACWLACALVAVGSNASAPSTLLAAEPATKTINFKERVQPFLRTYCFECHGDAVAKDELRLDTLEADFSKKNVAATWIDVFAKLREGEMPPAKQPQPPASETKTILNWIAEEMRGMEAQPAAVRRLNRYEYENTLRDLLALPTLEIKERLPADGEAEGFDKVGDGLDVSYVQMARYLEAADVGLEQASGYGLQPLRPEPQKLVFWPQDSYDWHIRVAYGAVIPLDVNGPHPCWDKEKGNVPREIKIKDQPRFRAMGTFFHADPAGHLRLNTGAVKIPAAGMYRIRISMYAFDWDKGQVLPAKEARPVAITTDVRTLGYFDAPPNEAAVSTITTWLEPTDFIHFNPVSLTHGYASKNGAAGIKSTGVAVEWMELEGPLATSWPPLSRTRLYGDLGLAEWQTKSKQPRPVRPKSNQPVYTPVSTVPMSDAQRLLKDFSYRSCRRPLTDEELKPYVALVQTSLEGGSTFEDAMRSGYKGLLCSPHFLFLRVQPGGKDAFGLGNRLSYFLWSSVPDEELLRLSNAKEILKADKLHAQVERLLKDPKSARFVESFTGQWLKLRDINSTQPDRQLYPESELEADVAPYLIDSMVDETQHFFAAMLERDLGVSHVVHSDFSFLNEPLAKLYNIPGVTGTKLQEVQLPASCRRGGILTQAAVLKVSANGTTTSPVVRGTYVTRRLLGRNVPPPPADVPGLDPDVRGATTIREQLEKHRAVEACSGCHAKLDPPGFALENFDVIGRWRERYRILTDKNQLERNGPNVDASGETENGKSYRHVDEFRQIALENLDQIARNLTSKLMIYAIGRPLTIADQMEVDAIVERTRDKKFGLRTLIHEIVQSRAFREG